MKDTDEYSCTHLSLSLIISYFYIVMPFTTFCISLPHQNALLNVSSQCWNISSSRHSLVFAKCRLATWGWIAASVIETEGFSPRYVERYSANKRWLTRRNARARTLMLSIWERNTDSISAWFCCNTPAHGFRSLWGLSRGFAIHFF